MSAHTRGPARRSRKPRPSGSASAQSAAARGEAAAAGGGEAAAARGEAAAGAGTPSAAARVDGVREAGRRRRPGRERIPAYRDFEQRPQAPWHPLPLSELLILAGAIAFAVALARLAHHGLASGGPLLAAGVLAVVLGTAEVSWREHRCGFRSHTLLLAFLPVLALHTAVVAGYSTLASPSRALNVGMLAVDAAVFALLARRLRARFADARARHQ
jgi:hypothetical protein